MHCDVKQKSFMVSGAKKLRKYYEKYHRVVCVADTVKESFDSLFGGASESVVLYNVNDEADVLAKAGAYAVEKPDVPVVAVVGRLSPEKGVDRLLEACAGLRNDGGKFCLRIVGDGPQRSELEQMAKELGLEHMVDFMGFQSNPYPVMAGADVIVCPSRYEGFSTVVTEALILGKPVVTTPCSGMEELLGDSEYGVITADSAEGIYEGLKKMLDGPELRKHYAEAAAIRGQAFSKEKLVGETEAFFRALLNE